MCQLPRLHARTPGGGMGHAVFGGQHGFAAVAKPATRLALALASALAVALAWAVLLSVRVQDVWELP